jgi:hypothetical protein
MSRERHNVIIVTCFQEAASKRGGAPGIHEAHEKALALFVIDGHSMVSNILLSPVNAFYSFMVGPDGSKEGWPESYEGDRQRKDFIRWMDSQRYDDGSSSLTWVEVQYGDGSRSTRLKAHAEEPKRKKAGGLVS